MIHDPLRCKNRCHHQFIGIMRGEIDVISCAFDQQSKEKPLRPAVSLPKRMEHIQIMIEFGYLGHKAIIGQVTKLICRFQTLKHRCTNHFQLIRRTEQRPFLRQVDRSQFSRPIIQPVEELSVQGFVKCKSERLASDIVVNLRIADRDCQFLRPVEQLLVFQTQLVYQHSRSGIAVTIGR